MVCWARQVGEDRISSEALIAIIGLYAIEG